MIEYGFLEREAPAPTVDEVLLAKHSGEVPELVTIESHHKVGEAIALMQRYSISQLPVVRTQPVESLSDIVGSLHERGLLDRVFKNPDALNDEVSQAMQPPLAVVDAADTLDRVFSDLTRAGARRWSSRAAAARRACSPARTCSSTSRAPGTVLEPHARGASPACRGGSEVCDPVPDRRRGRCGRRHPAPVGRAARLDLDRRPLPPPDAALARRPLPAPAPSRSCSRPDACSSTGRTRRACSRSRTGRSHEAGCSPGPIIRGGATSSTATPRSPTASWARSASAARSGRATSRAPARRAGCGA